MTNRQNENPELESFFMAARDAAPAVSTALFHRVLDDAAGHLDATKMSVKTQPDRVKPLGIKGLFASVLNTIGGWPVAAGLAIALMAGIFIGSVKPEQFRGFEQLLPQYDTNSAYLLDALSYDDGFWAEG